MRPVSFGRPGTKVIPDGWSDAHRPILATTHGASITLRHGDIKGTFNKVTGKYEGGTAATAYYDGMARIQVLATEDQEQATGGQEVTTLAYAIELEHDVAGMRLEDIVAVNDMDDNGDLDLVGRELIVRSFEAGSLHWERRLVCTLNLETQEA